MSGCHSIRLIGPWNYEVVARSGGGPVAAATRLPSAGRVKMPTDWGDTLGDGFRGRVRYVRKFNRPTGLVEGITVWLAVDQVDAFGTVALNRRVLGPVATEPKKFEIGDLLQAHNSIEIEVELPAQDGSCEVPRRADRIGLPGGLIGEVRLEIHPRLAGCRNKKGAIRI